VSADDDDLVRRGRSLSLRDDVGECLSLRLEFLTIGGVAEPLEAAFDKPGGAAQRGIMINILGPIPSASSSHTAFKRSRLLA
jgi:hypothetical protein